MTVRVPVSTWQYIILSCGHYTTSDIAALFTVFRTMPDTYWCRLCDAFITPLKLAPLPPQDDKPPF